MSKKNKKHEEPQRTAPCRGFQRAVPRYVEIARRGLYCQADMNSFMMAVEEAYALEQITTVRFNNFRRGANTCFRGNDSERREFRLHGLRAYNEANT